MITYEEFTWSQFIACSKDLLQAHYEELSVSKQFKLDIDFKCYENLEKMNNLYCLCALREEIIIGYALYFIYNHPHYNVLMADNDVLYLTPKERKGRTGLRIIKYAEEGLFSKGVKKIMLHAKQGTTLVELCRHVGYHLEDYVFCKVKE